MSYEILALDLDGTLTNSKKEISRPTLEALIDIQKHGKKVVLASGRPTQGVMPLAEQLHLSDYGSYILSFNGGRITDCRTKKAIYNKTVPNDVAHQLYTIAKKYTGIDIVTYVNGNILSGIRPNQYTELESRINNMPIIVADDFPEQITEPVNKFLIAGDPDIVDRVRLEIADYFRSYLYVYCSDPFFLEIMPPHIDKAQSLLRLLTSI